jgi:hypothetical protein
VATVVFATVLIVVFILSRHWRRASLLVVCDMKENTVTLTQALVPEYAAG